MSNRNSRGSAPEDGSEAGVKGGDPGAAPQVQRSQDVASPETRVAQLEEQLQQKTEEAAANLDRYLRAVADSENFKKRTQRDKADAIRFGNESLLRDVLPIVDNLEAALEHAELGGNGKSVVEGVQLILRLFREVLERQGVKEIADPSGRSFDPATQEAAEVETSAAAKPNTVIRQRQKGYRLYDRLLRPARVVVAADKSSDEDSGGSAR